MRGVECKFTGECVHESAAQKSLTSTWVLDEVRLAVQKGYKVLAILKVYEYEVTNYDPHTCEGCLFANYINTFLKLKAEASGYPSWVRNPEDEERYVENFYSREGVRLDRDAIRSNAPKRGLAKLCLKSLWGKLTEKEKRTHTKLISDPQELYRFLATPGVVVANLFASESLSGLRGDTSRRSKCLACVILRRSLAHS